MTLGSGQGLGNLKLGFLYKLETSASMALWSLTRSDTNRAVQKELLELQNFRFMKIAFMQQNMGADQQYGSMFS